MSSSILGSGSGSDSGSSSQNIDLSGPQKYALLVGCEYKRRFPERSLNGCFNDVDLVSRFLQDIYGFERKNIIILRDEVPEGHNLYPSRPNIIHHFKQMLERAMEFDMVFFFFAGHGANTNLEDDNQSHVFLPGDMNPLSALDLYFRVRNKKLKFTLMADCCFSGKIINDMVAMLKKDEVDTIPMPNTLTPDSPYILRFAKPREISYFDLLHYYQNLTRSNSPVIRDHLIQLYGFLNISFIYSLYMDNFPPLNEPCRAKYVLLTACMEHEKAAEGMIPGPNGRFQGFYTYAFHRALTRFVESIALRSHRIQDYPQYITNESLTLSAYEILIGEIGYPYQHPQLQQLYGMDRGSFGFM